MSIIAAELIAYASANMPEDDTSVAGGAIDATTKVAFTDIASTDLVSVISDAAGDTTQLVTVTGRLAGGAVAVDILSLNGTNRVVGTKYFERVLKVVVNASHTGTITVARNNSPTYTAIGTLESGVLALRRLFYQAKANVAGGATKNYYEKMFLKNTNSAFTLLSAVVSENADPTTLVDFTLENTQTGTATIANRLTVPDSGYTSTTGVFNSSTKSVPGTDLGSGNGIGVWVHMTLAANTSPAKSTYTLQLDGETT